MSLVQLKKIPSDYVSNVAYWQDFLTDDQLNLANHLADAVTTPAHIGGVVESHVCEINPVVRSTRIGWLAREPDTAALWDAVATAVERVNATYFQYDLDGFYEPGQLTKYMASEGGHYDWHMDADVKSAKAQRKLSCVILLNDPSEFTGGDLVLKPYSNEEYTADQQRGRMWCFPAWALHKVTPVTAGCRKTLVFWAGGAPFR